MDVTAGDTYKISGKSYYNQKLLCLYATGADVPTTVYSPQNSDVNYTDEIVTIPNGITKIGLAYYRPSYLSGFKLEKLIKKRSPIEPDELDIYDNYASANIYNYKDMVDGGYINYQTGNIEANTGMCYTYVPVTSGEYVATVSQNYFGSTASRIPYFDENKNYIAYIQGTFVSQDVSNLAIVSFTVPNNAAFIGISLRTSYSWRGMVVKNTEMPSDFIPFFVGYKALDNGIKVNSNNYIGANKNPLYCKTVAFDGDSICHGISAADNKSGWAGRIGDGNGMNWRNYGISGGTITNNHSHCILNTLENIHTYMPTLDYYIFEGGTNDADVLGLAGLGTFSEDDYNGVYNTDTFSGAFEQLIYNVLTYYPHTKIGYIVAQKMGKTNNANYPIRHAFFERAVEICKKWGIPYIDLWDGSHLNPNLLSMYDSSLDEQGNRDAGKLYIDGQHLTSEGYEYITPIIETWMKTM